MTKNEINQLDEQLRELALEAQGPPADHSQGKTLRRKALTQLVNIIWRSGKLCRPYSGQFQFCYEDIYDEAVQNLFLYICQKIKDYDPERGEVMTWVNVLITKRFFPEAIPKILGRPTEISLKENQLENLQATETVSVFEQLRQCIESDLEGVFRNEHIKGHPEANFQAIAIRRYSGRPWKAISAEWGIGVPTLNSFYTRCLKKFAPKFREYL